MCKIYIQCFFYYSIFMLLLILIIKQLGLKKTQAFLLDNFSILKFGEEYFINRTLRKIRIKNNCVKMCTL